jgi:hypothetical protein
MLPVPASTQWRGPAGPEQGAGGHLAGGGAEELSFCAGAWGGQCPMVKREH